MRFFMKSSRYAHQSNLSVGIRTSAPSYRCRLFGSRVRSHGLFRKADEADPTVTENYLVGAGEAVKNRWYHLRRTYVWEGDMAKDKIGPNEKIVILALEYASLRSEINVDHGSFCASQRMRAKNPRVQPDACRQSLIGLCQGSASWSGEEGFRGSPLLRPQPPPVAQPRDLAVRPAQEVAAIELAVWIDRLHVLVAIEGK